VFLVPSNHDLELSAKKEKYGKGDFENIFGPANFSFLYNGCLFIFISNIDQNDKEYCIYLEKLLSGRGPDIKKTFLFCPTPPRKVLNEVFPKSSQWTGDFDRIIEQYKVNYVISGDYHKHYELSSDVGVHYIVSGPGGSHFREKSLLGRIKSGTIMTVYPDHVTQQLLVCDKIVLTDNSIRHYIYKEILSKLSPKFGIINAIFAILILNALFAMYKFIRSVSV
jgi:hypothetical protein